MQPKQQRDLATVDVATPAVLALRMECVVQLVKLHVAMEDDRHSGATCATNNGFQVCQTISGCKTHSLSGSARYNAEMSCIMVGTQHRCESSGTSG